jgi:hypothetical protein
MKILLVNACNDTPKLSHKVNLRIPPLGLAYISYPLKKRGYKISFFDVSFSKPPNKEFNLIMDQFQPDIGTIIMKAFIKKMFLEIGAKKIVIDPSETNK